MQAAAAHRLVMAHEATSVLSRKFVEKLAPQERHNVAHGASRGSRHLPSSPFPSPARPAAQSAPSLKLWSVSDLRAAGWRERGAEGGVGAIPSPGLRPGLTYFAPSGLRSV